MKMGYYEFRISCGQTLKEPIIALVSDSGILGVVEDERGLVLYYPDTKGIDWLLDFFKGIKPLLIQLGDTQGFELSYSYLSERDWNETWKKRFVPLEIGGSIRILPPWETKKEGFVNLIIDPGMAFGTGHHETTQQCLLLILELSERVQRDSFLDLGTGSGILAILAGLIGFKEVVAIDNDHYAIDSAKRNLIENRLNNVTLIHGDVSEAKGQYDMVVANLLLNVLIENSSKIGSLLKPSGIAILSGLIKGQEVELLPRMIDNGLRPLQTYHYNNWATIVMDKSQ